MKQGWFSAFLVGVQFFCIILLLLTGPVLASHPLMLGMQIIAFTLGGWAVIIVGPGRFNIRPDPKPSALLVTSGPYQWIRHPMYTALLTFCSALVGSDFSWTRVAIFALLLGNMLVKLDYEESLLLERFPGYAAYRARTSRMIPFLY